MRRKTIDKHFQTTLEGINDCVITLMPQPRVQNSKTKKQQLVGGRCLQDEGVIDIRNRPDKENLVLTLIHEVWHYLRPKWTEKHIEIWSKKLFCEFSTNQHKILSRYLRRK